MTAVTTVLNSQLRAAPLEGRDNGNRAAFWKTIKTTCGRFARDTAYSRRHGTAVVKRRHGTATVTAAMLGAQLPLTAPHMRPTFSAGRARIFYHKARLKVFYCLPNRLHVAICNSEPL